MFQFMQNQILKAGTPKTIDSLMTDSMKKQRANPVFEMQAKAAIYDTSSISLDKEKPQKKKTLGKGWFDLEPMEMDDKLKRDVQMIQMRNYMDPKRFYKNPDKINTVLHIGTVVEGPSEYKSQRLTKKERKTSITEEILADDDVKKYSKRVFADIQKVKNNKKKVFRTHKKDMKKPMKSVRKFF